MIEADFLETYKEGNRADKEKSAYDYLITKLITDKADGDGKTDTIYGINIERKLGGNLWPSMFYLFKYASPKPDIIGKLAYMDIMPMLLCMKCDDRYVEGLNFNMLPNDVRASVLDIIAGSYSYFYRKIMKDEIVNLNGDFANLLVNENTRTGFILLLEQKTGMRIGKVYRRYDRKYMSEIRLIEYDHWKDIPYLCFKDAFRGATLADIQKAIIDGGR